MKASSHNVCWTASVYGSMKRRDRAVLADKAYSGHALRNELKNKDIKTVIPRTSNEKMVWDGRSPLDRDAYSIHNVNTVERCFGRMKASSNATTKWRGTICRWLYRVASHCFTKSYAIKGRSLKSSEDQRTAVVALGWKHSSQMDDYS